MTPCIIMRARNDMPLIQETLAGLESQDLPFRLVAFDNASTDGTRELLEGHADRIVDVPEGTYVPGRVLNRAMEVSDGDFTVFLNSDCTPLDRAWLRALLAGFETDRIAAVFGRQVPRPDCLPLFAKDTENTFGDGSRQAKWKHCFSMASSAIRRSVWETMPFNPDIQYSEDIEWTWRARQQGHEIRYCPESRVYHSHNYTLSQWRRRQYGEGKADARIFAWDDWERSWIRYSALPFVRQVLSDWKYGIRQRSLQALLHSPALRFVQMIGRRKGALDGFRS